MLQSIETTAAIVYRKADDIMVIQFKTDVLADRDHAIEIINSMLELANGHMHYVVVEARNILSNMTNDAQKYFAHESPFNEYTKAVAILLNNLPIRLTANMFILIQKPPFPVKTFKDMDSAEKWFNDQI